MRYEEKKILFSRLISIVVILLCIFTPIIISSVLSSKLEIVDDSGQMDSSYSCEIEVKFNMNVDSGDICVAFYDSKGNLLDKQTNWFYDSYGDTLSSTFYIDSAVDSYEILWYDVSIDNYYWYWFCIIGFIAFIFLICSLLLSYKAYDYCGRDIEVYAGFYHHYMKVDGIKTDEYNTIVSWTPIQLSCTINSSVYLQATISLTNRISLKINNMLYTKRK